MSQVLVLNADYSPLQVAPLSTLSWREAIKLVWLDQVEVLEYYNDWFVHSPSVTMQVPSVIVGRTYVKTGRSVKFNKHNLCIRDDFKCQYCLNPFDKNQLTMDHVIPRSRGGKTTWTNIVCACQKCNTTKGNRLQMKPHREPQKPSLGELLSKVKRMTIVIPDDRWIPYIGWPPHLVHVKKPSHNIEHPGVD